MKILITILTLISACHVYSNEVGNSPVDFQPQIEKFLAEHEVAHSTFYCRSDIPTPECRVLMRYKNKATGLIVNSFQIAFNAHFRQLGGTEFFLENSDGTFIRASDGTMDGKVNPVVDELKQVVILEKKCLKIVNIKFGTLIADLTFTDNLAEVKGQRDGQPVLLNYPRIK